MNKLLLALALVISFSVPASAFPAPRFRAIPEVSPITDANPGQRQFTSIEQWSQSREANDQGSDPYWKPCRLSSSHDNTCE